MKVGVFRSVNSDELTRIVKWTFVQLLSVRLRRLVFLICPGESKAQSAINRGFNSWDRNNRNPKNP